MSIMSFESEKYQIFQDNFFKRKTRSATATAGNKINVNLHQITEWASLPAEDKVRPTNSKP